MQSATPSPAQTAFALFQAGRNAEAAPAFEHAIRLEPRQITLHIGLAFARRAIGDAAGAETAIDGALQLDPRNIRALIFKGDAMTGRGRGAEAAAYYAAAVRSAQSVPQLPPDLVPEVARAETAAEARSQELEAQIVEALNAAGIDDPRRSPRFARSLDILFGRTPVYVQQPRSYHFPGLPEIEWYERDRFDWVEAVEAETDAIREEVLALSVEDDDPFNAYVEGDERPHADRHGMVGNTDWGAYYLWRDGAADQAAQGRCPAATRALEAAPLCTIPGATPSALFSRLRPGAAIPPHNGLINVRLICHLPLIIPSDCGLRVGGETRSWREGELVIFDDTIEHEAWNRSKETRVVLLFDIWRPELSEEERAMTAALLGAVGIGRD